MLNQECALSIIKILNITHQQSSKISREVAGAIIDGETGGLFEYQHLSTDPEYKVTWRHYYENEIGRLAQGMPCQVKQTNTMFIIKKDEVPHNKFRDVTFG